MKHRQDHPLAYQLGCHLGQRARSLLGSELPDLLIPVPMYWYRRFRRGINSASALADGASNCLQRPVSRQAVCCCRATRKQSMLSVQERRENVRRAFQFWRRRPLADLHIAIVDDTLTTGATADALAALLKSAGARRITVLVVARAIAEWKGAQQRRKSPVADRA